MNNIVKWNYTELAPHYDKRAEYSEEAVLEVLTNIGADPSKPVADIGAGTGKLTKILAKQGLSVRAVEPNDEMRKFGKENTKTTSVEWSKGTGEETGLSDTSAHIAFFGSSFNVTDREKTLKEVYRILVPNGWFVCMWNHRDLDNQIQKDVEEAIKKVIPDYNYGSRREDQTEVINKSNLFSDVSHLEKKFTVSISKEDYVEAWKSHGTLQRQAGDRFNEIIDSIEKVVADYDTLEVPYFTRIYYAQLKAEK
jgi:ubiquinone/menaquinone biosynthesis C-methylase UbiE